MGMKQTKSLVKWQNLGIIKSDRTPSHGFKASRTPIFRERMKMDTPAPVEGMNGTFLKIGTMRDAK